MKKARPTGACPTIGINRPDFPMFVGGHGQVNYRDVVEFEKVTKLISPHNSRAKSGLIGIGNPSFAAMVRQQKDDMILAPTTTTHASTLEARQARPITATLTSQSVRRKKV